MKTFAATFGREYVEEALHGMYTGDNHVVLVEVYTASDLRPVITTENGETNGWWVLGAAAEVYPWLRVRYEGNEYDTIFELGEDKG